MNVIAKFFLFGFAGICLEVLFTGAKSLLRRDAAMTAQTYLWMIPIYGVAGLFGPLVDALDSVPMLIRGLVWLTLIWAVEFTSGAGIRALIGACPWDYGDSRWSFFGLIRWDFAPAWYATGLLMEQMHRMVG